MRRALRILFLCTASIFLSSCTVVQYPCAAVPMPQRWRKPPYFEPTETDSCDTMAKKFLSNQMTCDAIRQSLVEIIDQLGLPPEKRKSVYREAAYGD